jgi:cytochrome c peroxidase
MDKNDTKGLYMMLPTDLALIRDAEYRVYVDLYADDNDLWMNDFGKAFTKLLELGVHRV